MRWAIVAVSVMLAASCSDTTEPPTEMRIDGVVVRTELEVYPGPGSYRVFLTIHNDTQAAAAVNWAGPCLIKARLYRGSRMMWDGISAFPNCATEVNTYTLAPGATYERIWGVLVDGTALGDSIPRGEYRIVAAVRPQGKGGPIYEINAGSGTF
jgi:hypothetical protein